MAPVIRVLIVDDEPIVRLSLARAIGRQPDMVVVGEAVDGYIAIRLVARLVPDVVVMDVAMPGPSGIDTANELRARGIRTPILFFTGDPGAIERASAVDASRVLLKAAGGASGALDAVRQLASAASTALITARAPTGFKRTPSATARASSEKGSPDISTTRSEARQD